MFNFPSQRQKDMQSWKRTAARNVNRLPPEEALRTIARIQAEGVTIFHKDIRDLTGGYNSQSINFHVIRLLAIRAGVIRSSK